ncbi:MAG: phytoene synthase [Candidatus Promineifilaceae bacterium]|jgi:phytoene synthase
MMVYNAWEGSLLSLAEEAIREGSNLPWNFERQQEGLVEAYKVCAEITAHNSKSFYLSSSLLRSDKKRAARALYAFCRITDDIIDEPKMRQGRPASEADILQDMRHWRRLALSENPSPYHPVAIAWADTRARFQIPYQFAEQLIDGVLMDMGNSQYHTFDELVAYSYKVASTVGLMSMHITGFSSPEAIPYAIRLGIALQMTNILRDVGEDWRKGRIYLPLEELEAFGLSKEDISMGTVDERWRAFMRFQINRNRQLYREASPGIQMLAKDGRFAIAASAGLYEAILEDIEKHDYNVFNRRSYISTKRKLSRLPAIWWQNRS